jgi:tRNA uridine 5-carboxymethylaminomethyl modification enzyme
MFTSRAEYRLQLRQDNADLRLTPIGREVGLVSDAHWRQFVSKRAAIEAELDRLRRGRDGGLAYADLLRRPEISYRDLPVANLALPEEVQEQVEIQLKYEGYIRRDLEHIARFSRMESKRLPHWINYDAIPALRFESRQKLNRYRPDSIGQASRISGVTPADIAVLLVWLKRAAEMKSS